ncbi:MAG TPA: hypothetical protein VGK45_18845, partial [Thermoanaerobaculia bacterium]
AQCERRTPPFILAERAAKLYRCRIDVFLTTPGGGKPTGSHSAGEQGKGSLCSPESTGDALVNTSPALARGEKGGEQ